MRLLLWTPQPTFMAVLEPILPTPGTPSGVGSKFRKTNKQKKRLRAPSNSNFKGNVKRASQQLETLRNQ